ncbi:MAG: class I SAM-dependent methyltransferase [Actinobacteria bacterium]|nr:class I SAM-dependent methyltransferase [Actinomycetota bacterium]
MINPKDLIKKLTVEELCLTADNYFKSISDPTPQMAKPFSFLLETPELLQNMGLLLSELRLGKTMTVLEFGAGTCWFSRFLNQLQCQTISCDASKTALEIGRRLFAEFPIIGNLVSEPLFLHFNGHKIDLPDESVDRIICLDAFHHIPNQDEVISELARVLKKGGVAGFSEPGKFHSQSPQSQYEMKNYNVLENDIDITEIFYIAKKSGFTDIKCKLLCDMGMSLNQYQSLISKRQNAELEKNIFDNIRNVMTNKTIFFLYKGEFTPDSRSHIGLSHSISIDNKIFSIMAGEVLNLSIRISNNGSAKWLNKNINYIGVVKIGTHLYDEANNLLNLDFSRHDFTSLTAPGETIDKTIAIRFSDIGIFRLAIDLVSEGICWFENIGSKPQYITVNVK